MARREQPNTETLMERARKPVRLMRDGRLFVGDDEINHPILAGSIKFEPIMRKHNLLTMTLIVGEVTMEAGAAEVADDAE